MFSLSQPKPAAAPQVAPTLLLAGLTPACEAIAQDAVKQHKHVALTTVAALETQQLDHSAEEAALDEVKETLDKYDEEHPHTGPLHVYLLDGAGAAVMDQEGQDTPLKALVNAALSDPRRTIAALMPEDVNYKQTDDIAPSQLLRQLADTILSTESVVTLVGKAAFEAFVADPEGYLAQLKNKQ